MPTKTAFLGLTLPAFQEFINSWNDPVNQNMQDIDAWTSDLFESLVGSSSTGVWASLRGLKNSLADRLAVSIKTDGSLDLTTSPDILALATSSTEGKEATPDDDPRGRFDRSDFEIYDARQPVVGGRFVPIGTSGSAGFPGEELDAGMALRVADFGAKNLLAGVGPISSPQVPSAPGLVVGGAANLISIPAGNRVIRINGGGSGAAVFNIDGYMFRVREDIDLDYTGLTPTPSSGNHVWVYVSRDNGDYNNAEFKYNQDGGPAAKDLRILQNGSAGSTVTLTKIFTDANAKFLNSVIGKVKTGDILVITSPSSAAGKYVIDTVDSDTQLHIRGEFKADISALATWHVQDDHHPNIGVVEGTSDPETLPSFVAGRVYIGRVTDNGPGQPINPVTFRKGGVFDSGWTTGVLATAFPLAFNHNLGVAPTEVSVFFRLNATAEVYSALVQRQVVSEVVTPHTVAGDVNVATLLVPSIYWNTTTERIEFRVLNALPNNVAPVLDALFTDNAGVDHGETGDPVEMRVIAKR